jgi:hypothetical protein
MGWQAALLWSCLISAAALIYFGTRKPKRRYRAWLKQFMERE